MEVIGIGYLAIICQNIDETVNFYCNGLGFEKIYQEPNRDDPESTQVFLMNKNALQYCATGAKKTAQLLKITTVII